MQLLRHRFVRDLSTLQAGSMAANILQALAGIVLARILQPELFGIYALVFSFAGLINIVLGIGAHGAVVTILGEQYARRDREQVREAFAFLAKMTVVMGAVALAGAALAPRLADAMYGNAAVGWYAAVVVVAAIVSTTAYSFTTIALQVAGRIRSMTLLGFWDQILKTGLSLGFVLLGLKVFGIVLGHFVAGGVMFAFSVVLWRRLVREVDIFPSVRRLLREMVYAPVRKYLGFSLWVSVDKNVSNLYNILPVMLTGIYVSASQVTYFKLAFGYLNLALSFLGPIGVLLNVEFPRMKVDGAERLARNFTRVTLYALGLSALLTAGAAIVAPLVFRILYGESFLPSVRYVYGLIPYAALMGIGIGLGSMFRAIDRVRVSVLINALNLGIGVPAALWLLSRYGLWGAVVSVTVWYVAAHLAGFLYIRRYLVQAPSGEGGRNAI